MKQLKNISDFLLKPATLIYGLPLLLIIPNVWLDCTEQYSAGAMLANVLLPLGVYLILMCAWKRTGAVALCMTIFSFFAAFQIVLLMLYGESIIAIDMFLNVATTNVSEATELLGNLTFSILLVLVLYVPPMVIGVIQLVKGRKAHWSVRRQALRLGGVLATSGAIIMIVTSLTVFGYTPTKQLFPVNVTCNMIDAAKRTKQSLAYFDTSADFSYNARRPNYNDSARQVYVLVIGETSRAENWQLFGYDRPTNPRLSQRNDIITFDRAMSESNTTHKSVPMLLSCLTASNFADSVNHVKSIFEAYNTTGFTTVFLTNQQPNHSYIDYFGNEASKVEHTSLGLSPGHDRELLKMMREQLADTTDHQPIIIVVHTYGSHYNYTERYTDEYRHFTPDHAINASAENRLRLINAYDNTIVYTDALLGDMIEMLDSLNCEATLLYTSDHGEDIFDDSRNRFLHASPTPTFHQLHVPMLLWMSPEYREAHPRLASAALANSHQRVSTTRTVFDTMLGLSGLTTDQSNSTQSLVSNAYKPSERKYLNDYNEGVDLSESGLRQPDFYLLDHLDSQK